VLTLRMPATLKVAVPLILLAMVVLLGTINVLYNLPRAERLARDSGQKLLTQEMSRLQSTVEYLLLKGDLAAAQHQIAVVAHNHDYRVAALTDDRQVVIAATRRAWLDRPLAEVMPELDGAVVEAALSQRRTQLIQRRDDATLIGFAGILVRGEPDRLRPSRTGGLVLVYDLEQAAAEARATVLGQSLYWAGSVAVLALVLWLALHVLVTRPTARLVAAAERIAAGDGSARSGLAGDDELGRLGRAFDAMAQRVEAARCRLLQELAARERARRAMEVSEASYRAIFEASEDAIFVHDIATGAIVDANPRACRAFGYSSDELRRLDVGALSSGAPPYTQADAMAVIARAAAGEPLSIEWHSRHRDGTLRWDEVFVKRVAIGGSDRILAIARDITDRKRAVEELARQREALHQREKLAALGSLLAGVAHELNNPLSVVVARAVLLEEQGGASTQTAAQKIRAAAERCARIVRTFLAMARRQQPERAPVMIADVVAAALDIAGYAIRSSGITVSTRLAADLPLILADADQLHQVLLNLLINSQQALAEQPVPRRIAIAGWHDTDRHQVALTVHDNGPGVAPALRSRVFEPYFTTKAVGTGTGVGLAVSLGIVEAHGGSLTLDSPAAGGARFTIALPADDAPGRELEMPVADRAVAAGGGCTVLVIDDEDEVRETLSEILRAAGHRVTAVGPARRALARLQVEPFDVIVTDIRMADLDGRDLYREIVRRWPQWAERCVFVTGDSLAPGLREFMRESRRPVIDKPFLPAEVRRIVAEAAAAQSPNQPRIESRPP